MRRTLIVSAVMVAATATATGATADNRQSHLDTGGKIVFTSNRTGQNEIVVANADGTGRIDLNAQGRSPEFSPDGRSIAFASVRDGNSEIYVMNADGSNQARLTFNTLYDSRPQWTADGRMLVFTRITADGNWEIFRMNADGSDQVDVTNDPAFERGQSTRGDRIVFTREEGGVGHIFEMNIDGHGLRRITNTSAYDSYPNQSPRGDLVLFSRDTADGSGDDLWVTREDGLGERQLTHQSTTGYISEATWSPDGSQILYSQCAPGGANPCALHVMNADGSNDHDISALHIPFVDDFSSAPLDAFWSTQVTGTGPVMEEVNGRLEITVPPETANDPVRGYAQAATFSRCNLAGDFDMQVDYALLDWPSPDFVNVDFTEGNFIGGSWQSANGIFVTRWGTSTNFPPLPGVFVPGTPPTGALRLTREGSTLTASYLDGTAWVPLQSRTIAADEVDATLDMFSNAPPFSHGPTTVAFDNFSISTGTFSCPTWWSDNFADWAPFRADR